MAKQLTNNGPLKESADKHSIYTFNTRNFLYSCGRGILELHLRVIRCNSCSSIIVSTHHPENIQLITYQSKRFF